MEMSHLISDGILTIVSLYVFFKYLTKLEISETLLWESFILSVGVAALFGTIRYAGVEKADSLSLFFQHLASTIGALGLLAVTWSRALNKPISKTGAYVIVGLGFVLFALVEAFGFVDIVRYMPLVCIPLVAVAAIVSIVSGKVKFGSFVLLGVLFLALAVFRDKFVGNLEDGIDAYHYLLAVAVLSLGLAANTTLEKKGA